MAFGDLMAESPKAYVIYMLAASAATAIPLTPRNALYFSPSFGSWRRGTTYCHIAWKEATERPFSLWFKNGTGLSTTSFSNSAFGAFGAFGGGVYQVVERHVPQLTPRSLCMTKRVSGGK